MVKMEVMSEKREKAMESGHLEIPTM